MKKTKKGFSFIESMLSVFLVSVGLIVSVKLLTAGLAQSFNSRDQFVASLLAQEGAELVRNIRDNNWVDNNPTTGSFGKLPTIDSDSCRIDKNDMDISSGSCGGAVNMQLFLSGGYYVNQGGAGTATKYFRRIKFDYDITSPTVLVTSLVSWDGAAPAVAETSCNTANKCAYTQITLNKWGE